MTRRQAVLALWATCLIWGAAFPLVKLALRDATPMAFTAARFLVATVLIAPMLRGTTRDEWRAGAVLGLADAAVAEDRPADALKLAARAEQIGATLASPDVTRRAQGDRIDHVQGHHPHEGP